MTPTGQFWRRCWRSAAFLLLSFSAHAAGRTPWTSGRVAGSPNPPAPYMMERQFPQLAFRSPVDLAALPGTDLLLVLEQPGKLWCFRPSAGVIQTNLVFDFRSHHQPFDAAYSIAFHPRFLENRHIFVCYVEPGGRTNGSFISRFTLTASNPPVIDPASEKVILRWHAGGHNGATVAFGNDGMLYICNGDAANPDPPDGVMRTGQDISDLLGGILRIDVDRTEGANNYAIPRDNPFISAPGARPEVYAFGMRNPWRMSFDRATGDLWVGDVGWEQWEMIYRVAPGGNYGWPITEGPNAHVRSDIPQGPGPILPAMAALPHSDAASITGGLVYHGKKLAKLRGAYIYGDWETGKFWALRQQGGKLASNEELCDTTLKPVSFAEDHNGELLILDYNGGIYALAPNTAPPANLAFPRRLSETGIFADTAKLAPAPGVEPYKIAAEMWNDHAKAQRVLAIPGSDSIATADGRETITGRMWHFPSNTVFARTLTLEMDAGQPASARKIETQMMHFDGQAWNAYTYRWNTAQNDAELVPAEGTNDVFSVTDAAAPGGRREIPWRFLSRAECFRCHNVWASDALSFHWLQLNTREEKPELKRLEEKGLLRVKNPPRPLLGLANPADETQPLADRARSWLHVNCSGCHRFGAGGGVPAQLNFDQDFNTARVAGAIPTRGDFGMPNARVVAEGDPHRSTLYYRVSTEGAGHMPHIGSRLVDEAGVRLLREWIRSLSPKGEDGETARSLAAENEARLGRLSGAGKAAALEQLFSNTSGALALADSLPSQSEALRAEIIGAGATHASPQVRDLFQRFLPPGQRRRVLGAEADPRAILSLSGNAERGKDVFLAAGQCANCHVSGGAGRSFGPDLTEIRKKYDRTQVLDHILNPSRQVAPEYKTVSLTLRDDTELSGFVLKRGSDELILRDAGLADHVVRLADVKESRESSLSAMPEGLIAPLTAQEAADLLDYLMSADGR